MRAWVDIDNSPQVQYLVPLGHAFEQAGLEVMFTARDQGMTLDLLRARGVPFIAVGEAFGQSKLSKASGVVRRAWGLRGNLGPLKPTFLVSASRSSALTARGLRIPSFILVDYEFVHLGIYGKLGSTLVFPRVIDPEVFIEQGFSSDRLLPFDGIKEDITFHGQDIAGAATYPIAVEDASLVRVLFRPPAVESHYHRERSSLVAQELLSELAQDPRVAVVLSPRYTSQAEEVSRFAWINRPVLLSEAAPFIELLKSVDLVVSAGGTMLREAAYLGVPAYSVFQGPLGAVDKHLESQGRLVHLRAAEDFPKLRIEKLVKRNPLAERAQLADDVARSILERILT